MIIAIICFLLALWCLNKRKNIDRWELKWVKDDDLKSIIRWTCKVLVVIISFVFAILIGIIAGCFGASFKTK